MINLTIAGGQVIIRIRYVQFVHIIMNVVQEMMAKGKKMKIRIGSRLIIENPIAEIRAWCKDHLILDNPDYYKKEQMGKWTGDTPSKLYLYEVMGDEIWLPFGCLKDIWEMHPIQADYEFNISPIRALKYESGINLYPYQEKAVNEVIRAKNGVLVMPCGSGKTQCGLEIISRLGGKALWLTHTQDLLNQSKARAESVLPGCGLGTITAGKVNLGSHITFATVQTMAKLDLSNYKDQFDVIIVDEAQHCAGTPTRVTQFYKVVSRLSARYKIGLTATPKRADGLQAAMFALLGGKIYEVTRDEVAHTTCTVKGMQVDTGWQPDYECVLMGDGTIDYHKVIENMVEDEHRFDVVFTMLADISGGYAPTMVLANRVEYLKQLCTAYNEGQLGVGICLSGMGQSKGAKEERKKALAALESGEIDCIFATYQLAKEGLDVPSLRYVVFATPEKDETTVVQAVGRVGRKAEGKAYGTVIDFVDDFGMYQGWAKKRRGYYKKIGAKEVD